MGKDIEAVKEILDYMLRQVSPQKTGVMFPGSTETVACQILSLIFTPSELKELENGGDVAVTAKDQPPATFDYPFQWVIPKEEEK